MQPRTASFIAAPPRGALAEPGSAMWNEVDVAAGYETACAPGTKGREVVETGQPVGVA